MYKSRCTLLPRRRLVLSSCAVISALPLSLSLQQPAQALSFRFDFDRNVPDEFQLATQEAADAWSSVLKDDVVVDLRIEYKDLSSSGAVLGGIQPAKVKVEYEDYVNALFRDAVSTNDVSALNSLPLSSEGREIIQSFQPGSRPDKDELKSESFAFLRDKRFSDGRNQGQSFVDSDRSANNKNVLLTKAQASALGLGKGSDRGLDGFIKLNSSVNWDVSRRDGISSDSYDLTSVLQHEIGHALGFVSGVDALDFLASASDPVDLDENSFSYLTPLDLYRYSNESAALGVADVTLGGSDKYFSLDGGKTAVVDENGQRAAFSTGSQAVGGDGYQASHWKPGQRPLGVMSSVLQKGQSIDISDLDLTLLDSIGWDTEDNSAKKAAAIGLNWQQLTDEIAQEKSAVTNSLVNEWGDRIPAFEAALADASAEADLEFQEKFRKEFNELVKETDEGKPEEREKKISEFRKKVRKESEKRNEEISKLPKDIYKIDEKVSEWLTFSTDKLSDKVKDANGAEINRLSNLVKAAPASERAALEPKLEAAFAQFSDKPDKLLKELLDSSGPANPVSWGLGFRTWWYLQETAPQDSGSEEVIDPGLLYATGDVGSAAFSQLSSADLAAASVGALGDGDDGATDIPEPSSVLALFGIAVLGIGATRRR